MKIVASLEFFLYRNLLLFDNNDEPMQETILDDYERDHMVENEQMLHFFG